MNSTLSTTIDAEIALLAEEVSNSGDLAYGTDLSCFTDLTDLADEVDPNSALGIAQAIARRWQTANGTLVDDRDYGTWLGQFLQNGVPVHELPGIAGRLEMEALKDDRVESITVTVAFSADLLTLSARAYGVAADPRVEGFAMTFVLTSDGNATVEAIRA